MILVDSSVWIDYFRGTATPQANKLDELLGTELLAIGDLILTEVLQGFGSEREFNAARKVLLAWTWWCSVEPTLRSRRLRTTEIASARPDRTQDH